MLAAGTSLGPYKILAPLGAGGMGEVYRARDTRLGRDVAIKVIPAELARDPERIKRFEQEARAAGALSHPNVCAIFDVGAYEGAPFVVMELLEGETLRERLGAGPIPVRKAIDYAAQAARGLAAAHEKGIVHRDLKPENLFVTKDGRVKVLDFGLAKLTRPEVLAPAGEKPTSVAPTETGAILGTVGYMAPEQVRGQAADARSDLFALGAILYELLTGKRAFHGASYVETLNAILNEEPAPLAGLRADVPPALEPIVRHCLEKNPEERFQSARDLAFDLEVVGGSIPGTPPATAGKRAAGRGRFGFAAASFLVGAGLVAAIAFLIARGTHVTDASRLTYTRLTVQRGFINQARISPDGKTIFYAARWDGHAPEVFEARPGFLASRALGLTETNLLSISRDGRMAVLLGQRADWRWGTLAEVPISGGVPRRILDDVRTCDWSPDGKTLAVVHRKGDMVRLEMPPGRVLYQTAGLIGCVRVSHDGRHIAIVENPQPGDSRGRVVILDDAGRVLRRSTKEWNYIGDVAWTPDDREAWFAASEDGAKSEIRAVSPGGRERVIARLLKMIRLRDVGANGQVLIVQANRQVGILGRASPSNVERELGWFDDSWPVDISSDGRSLLFAAAGAYGGNLYAVCLRGMDGSPPVRLGEGDPNALSSDGRWALAIHYGPPQRLLLLPTGAGDSTALPRGPIERYFGAGWLPDGKGVVFAGSEADHAQRTYIQDLAGGLPRAITPEGIAGWRVSLDGRLVAALSRDLRLYVCPTNGDSGRVVTGLLPGEAILQWSSDGRSVYVAEPGPSMNVFRIDVATGKRSHWRTFSLPDSAGVSIINAAITPNDQSYAFSHVRELDDLYLVEGLK